MSEVKAMGIGEIGEPIRDEHGPAAPSPEAGLSAARKSGLLPDPAQEGVPIIDQLADAPRPELLNPAAEIGDEDFRCQAYGNGKHARCDRCGTEWRPGTDKSPPCSERPVPGWLHAVLPHGPRHCVAAKPTPAAKPTKPENRVSRPKMDGGGLRFSLGKNKIDLVPPEWVWALGMVLTRGAIKYAVRNWERGMRWSEVVGPMFRHIFKFLCGERYDPETGCHHMAMVAWNALVLMTYDIREIGENDLVGDMRWLDLVAIDPGPELQAIIDRKKAEIEAARAKA